MSKQLKTTSVNRKSYKNHRFFLKELKIEIAIILFYRYNNSKNQQETIKGIEVWKATML